MVRDLNQVIFVAGHRGMVGSAIVRRLKALGYQRVLTAPREELNLLDQAAVQRFFCANRIDQVYLAAARVGGIHANNTYPADFIYENLMIEANVIQSAHINGVQKLLFLGSSCIYPKYAEQPMAEQALLTGPLESTNESYAIAKIAGVKLCESYNRQYGCDYRSVMSTNLYGPGDNYHPENSHVLPALIRRFHDAKLKGDAEVMVWGSRAPRREFLYVDDMAAASVHVMNLSPDHWKAVVTPMCSHINVGSDRDYSIFEVAKLVAQTVGYCGDLFFDVNKPDGVPRKLMSSAKLTALGWKPEVTLDSGLRYAYEAFSEARHA